MSEVGEEAVRVLDAVGEWLRREPIAEHLAPSASGTSSASGSSECSWCPVCQLVGVLRGERPDVNEKISALLTALRGVFEDVDRAGTAARHPPPRVQRIDLGPDLGSDTDLGNEV